MQHTGGLGSVSNYQVTFSIYGQSGFLVVADRPTGNPALRTFKMGEMAGRPCVTYLLLFLLRARS